MIIPYIRTYAAPTGRGRPTPKNTVKEIAPPYSAQQRDRKKKDSSVRRVEKWESDIYKAYDSVRLSPLATRVSSIMQFIIIYPSHPAIGEMYHVRGRALCKDKLAGSIGLGWAGILSSQNRGLGIPHAMLCLHALAVLVMFCFLYFYRRGRGQGMKWD